MDQQKMLFVEYLNQLKLNLQIVVDLNHQDELIQF